jgi:Tol biopolymer transport system component
MGEVYRARDTKLGRDVALKTLPEAFAGDPDRLMRFEREARTLAALNHPNIAQVYGFVEADASASAGGNASASAEGDALASPGTTRALVMELVAGEDLSARIARGPIPLDEALPIARQIAEALEAAHEAGIIHRDLKPANIKVRDDGTVKVLDFGLAKALDSAPDALGDGATITSPALTVRGVILGTAAYMAPEQAKGKPVDRRADIWAFGCVLYEMLTGTRAFKGDDITDTLTAVLRDEPDWTALPADLPSHMRALLRRCLMKDPKQRLRDIGDARLTLEEPAGSTVSASPAAPRGSRARRAAWLAGALVFGALTFAAARLTVAPVPPPAEVRFEVPTPSAHENWFAISPDGRRLAFVTEGRLAIRDMDSVEARVLPATGGATNPTWSPSGRSIAYTENFNRLVRVAADGTARETIADQATGRPAWLAEDELVFTHADTGQLHRVPASGGAARPLFPTDAGGDRQTWPAVLPGTDRVLYLSRPPGDARQKELRIGSAATGTSQSVARSDSMGVFAGRNTVLFIRNNDLFAQAFDADLLAVVGEPVRVSPGVSFNTQNGRGGFDASTNGLIVLRPGSGGYAGWTLRQLSRDGQLVKHFADVGQPLGPALSPDGTRVAFHRMEADGGGDVWMLDLSDAVQRWFTFERSQENASPVWSPDGRRLVYRARREAKWAMVEKAADGTGGETTLAEFPHVVSPMSWSPDGMHLLFMVVDPMTSWDIWQYSFADRTATPLLNGPRAEGFPQFSPDGRWFAYNAATATPTQQVFVESFPQGRGKWQLSSDSGQYPRWSANGREIYFLHPVADARSEVGGLVRTGSDHWAAVAVDVRSAGEGLGFGPPRRLFETRGVFGGVAGYSGNYNAWAVSGEGQRFFLQQPEATQDTGQAPLLVIMNHPALGRPRD